MYKLNYNGKTLKSSPQKRQDAQLIDLCLVVTYINPAIHAPGVYTSHGVIRFYLLKMGKNFLKNLLKL